MYISVKVTHLVEHGRAVLEALDEFVNIWQWLKELEEPKELSNQRQLPPKFMLLRTHRDAPMKTKSTQLGALRLAERLHR